MNVVFWGDSMVRQIFNRIPSMFRGEPRTFESNRWRAERYDVCECVSIFFCFLKVAPRRQHDCLYNRHR